MNTKKSRRRGVVLSLIGQRKLEAARRQLEKTVNYGDRFTLEEISDRTQLALSTVTRVLEAQSGVDKLTLDQFFASFDLLLERSDYQHPDNPDRVETLQDPPIPVLKPEPTCLIDWGEAIDVSDFYGRTTELATLEQWIEQDRCRLIAILGMGGIGKTALSVKLAQQLPAQFEFAIWRSLRNAPPLDLLLTDLIQVLSRQQEVVVVPTISTLLARLMHYLRQHRCLLILDNGETILQGGQFAGAYRQGYETYGEWLQQVGEMPHQSCLVLTSREKPEAIATLEGETLPVRSFALAGLPFAASNSLFDATGLSTSPTGRHRLLEIYSGNPLALKIVSTSIRELFGGDVEAFLAEETAIFNGIRRLLDRQFQRLTDLEKQVMYWLAIDREWVTISELQADLVPPGSKQRLMETLESLARRSLIERSKARFTQQPVVMEYMTEQLIDCICEEIRQQAPQLFLSHALIKASAKDYVRESQIRVILTPLGDRLRTLFDTHEALTHQYQHLLQQLHDRAANQSGYGAGNLLNLLHHLNIDLTGWDFSHLTIRQAWLSDAPLHRVNLSHAHFVACLFAEPLAHPTAMAVSPDGDRMAIGCEDGTVQVWQVSTGQPQRMIQAHMNYIFALAFSQDGQTLASGGLDASIRFWDLATGTCFQSRSVDGPMWSLQLSPDGQLLAGSTSDKDRSIHVWDGQTGKHLKTLVGHTGQASSLAFAPMNAVFPAGMENRSQKWLLVSGGQDCQIAIWDLDRGDRLKTLTGHAGMIFSVSLHPQGHLLASASFDKSIKLWDLATGECLGTLLGHTAEVDSVSFSPNGQLLASGSNDRTIRLWDVATGQCLQVLQGHLDHVWKLAFTSSQSAPERSARAQMLVSVSMEPTVRFWHIGQLSPALPQTEAQNHSVSSNPTSLSSYCIKTIRGSSIGLRTIAFHPQSRFLASAGCCPSIWLWNRSGQCVKVLGGHTAGLWKIAFHPQGKLLASGSLNGEIKIWEIETGRCLHTLLRQNSWIQALGFSPQGYLATGSSSDATLRLWDVQRGECIRSMVMAPDAYALGLAFHPQGRYLVSASNDDRLRWWDVESGECLRTVDANHKGHAWCVAFHPQGHLLASAGNDLDVKLWDAESGECCRILQGHTGVLGSLAFSSDGAILASGRSDCTVRLWDVETGQCLHVLAGHTNSVTAVAFSPIDSLDPLGEGQQILASGSHDETIRLWDVRSGECLQVLRPDRLYEAMNITGVSGLSEGAIATLKKLGAVAQ